MLELEGVLARTPDGPLPLTPVAALFVQLARLAEHLGRLDAQTPDELLTLRAEFAGLYRGQLGLLLPWGARALSERPWDLDMVGLCSQVEAYPRMARLVLKQVARNGLTPFLQRWRSRLAA